MPLRFDGQLKQWNADRGMGSVAPEQGGDELSVHISAFPRGGRVPVEGEALSFEVEAGRDGKKCAVRIQRHAVAPPALSAASRHRSRYSSESRDGRALGNPRSSGLLGRLVGLVIVAALGWYAYTHEASRAAQVEGGSQLPMSWPAVAARPANFACDSRQHCSQMTSCQEAKLYLQHCRGVQMDGDGDGVPCEQQLCNGPFGN